MGAELERQKPPGDRELAVLYGEEFGLGTFERVWHDYKFPVYYIWGSVGIVLAILALVVVAGVAIGPFTAAAKVTVAAVDVGVWAVSYLVFAVGAARATARKRLFRYAGGFAQLSGDEPEPLVARWADVAEVTVRVIDVDRDDTPWRLASLSLLTVTGARLGSHGTDIRESDLHAVLADAYHHLAPRLLPAMTEQYDSAGAVSFGRVRVGRDGVTVRERWLKPDVLIPWAEITGIYMRSYTNWVDKVRIHRDGEPDEEISVSYIPNGIFFPPVLAYAAAQHGIREFGWREPPARLN
jgi:hypothetical protein